MQHEAGSDSLLLTPVSNDEPVPEVLRHVLVVLKQPAVAARSELFMKGVASTASIKLTLDTLEPGSVAVRLYVLDEVHIEEKVWIYKKTQLSEETSFTWPAAQTATTAAAASSTPLKLPGLWTVLSHTRPVRQIFLTLGLENFFFLQILWYKLLFYGELC